MYHLCFTLLRWFWFVLCDHERWHYEDEFSVALGRGRVGVHLQKHTEYKGGLSVASSKTAVPLKVSIYINLCARVQKGSEN